MVDREADLRGGVTGAIDAAAADVIGLSKYVHANPELAMEEFKAAAACCDLLRSYGFDVTEGVAGLPTAFVARCGAGRPRIGILVEYDALPGVGHGCGHNLLCGATIGAGLGVKGVLEQIAGEVIVFGTPAEEGKGGKVYMARAGLFEGLDAVLGTHPHPSYAAVPIDPGSGNALACESVEVEFFGAPAHAARDPHNGINALNAVIETFNGINALRQHIKPSARIHGVIRNGGVAVNVVPEYAKAEFLIRAETRRERDELVERVCRIAEGAALITGARLQWTPSDVPYDDMVSVYTINRRLKANFDEQGLATHREKPGPGLASSDIGNVSYLAPTGAGFFPIVDKVIPWHSHVAAEACNTDYAYANMIRAAKGIALTALELFTQPDLLVAAQEEHRAALAGRQD